MEIIFNSSTRERSSTSKVKSSSSVDNVSGICSVGIFDREGRMRVSPQSSGMVAMLSSGLVQRSLATARHTSPFQLFVPDCTIKYIEKEILYN